MSVPGFPEARVQILSTSGAPDLGLREESGGAAPGSELLTEVCWVLTYLTAGAEAHLNRMVALGVVPPLVQHLHNSMQQVSPAAAARPSSGFALKRRSEEQRSRLIPLHQHSMTP